VSPHRGGRPQKGRDMPVIQYAGADIGRGEIIAFDSGAIRLLGHLESIPSMTSVRPVRLPRALWRRFPPKSAAVRAQFIRPSGVRISLTTAATSIVMRVRCTRMRLPQVDAERNGFSLCVDHEEIAFVPSPIDAYEVIDATGTTSCERIEREFSEVRFDNLPPRIKNVEIWLPQMMIVDLFDMTADATFDAPAPSSRPVWVHYGSSISHGGNAERPTQTMPAVAARDAGLQLVNLGVAGQCHIDPFVASAIADIRPELISLELGVNVVGSRSLDQRSFAPAVHGFIDTVRAANPDVPILVITPLLWRGNETQAGPGDVAVGDDGVRFFLRGTEEDVQAGALSMQEARDQLRDVVSVRQQAGEPTELISGLELYGEEDAASWPFADSLHPDSDQSVRIGLRLARSLARTVSQAGLLGTQ